MIKRIFPILVFAAISVASWAHGEPIDTARTQFSYRPIPMEKVPWVMDVRVLSTVAINNTQDYLSVFDSSALKWTKIKISDFLDETSGITGSGTSGQIAYWTSASTLTSHSLFLYNGSNFSVGTVSNQQKLNVGSTAHSYMETVSSGAAFNAGVIIGNTGDSTNTVMLRRNDDGVMMLTQSDTFPYATDNDSILFHYPATKTTRIGNGETGSVLRIEADTVKLNGTAIALTSSDGVWTPTLTNTLNLDGSTAFECQYLRVGNTVTVSGRVSMDATATGAVGLGMTIPVASNFSAIEKAGGTATSVGANTTPVAIYADTANDRLTFFFTANDTTNQAYHFTATYRIE